MVGDLKHHARTAAGARELADLVDAPLGSTPEALVTRVIGLLETGRLGWDRVVPAHAFVATNAADDPTPLTEIAEPLEAVPEYAIVIELVGEDDGPIPGVKYELALPDGSIRTGSLDSDGRAELGSLTDPGDCKVCFPTLDQDAWEYIHATPL